MKTQTASMPRLGKWEATALFQAGRNIDLRRIEASTNLFCDPGVNVHSAEAVRQLSSQSCAWHYAPEKNKASLAARCVSNGVASKVPAPEIRNCDIQGGGCESLPIDIFEKLNKRPAPPLTNYSSLKGRVICQLPSSSCVGLLDIPSEFSRPVAQLRGMSNGTPTANSDNQKSSYRVVAKFYSTAEITCDPRRTGREHTPRFFNEANAYAHARAAQGTALPYVFGLYEDAGAGVTTGLFLVMEYLPFSTTLKDMDSRVRSASVTALRRETALALEALHSVGLSHGSMKSDQLLVCTKGDSQNEFTTPLAADNWFAVVVDLQYAR
jgi:serine/threonine protein kinase